ncbi:MAG: hypothetical protein NUV63_13905 [Gallionella sp.]|nr:hypothetical protein [Gallionella sp.]
MKIKCTLHAQADKYAEGGFSFHVFHRNDMTYCGYVACDTVEVEFAEPPIEALVNGAVAAYRKEQERIRAEAHSKVSLLDEEIQKLLCIEHKPDLKVVA